MCECSREIDRQVGVLVDRRGNIEHVIVGDQHKLVLPDLGPRRAGVGRFRGVRLVHTHLRGEPLTRDDLIDLAKLRLDLVGGDPDDAGRAARARSRCAHLLPPNPDGEQWRVLEPISAHELQRRRAPDFLELIRALEDEFADAGARRPRRRRRQGSRGAGARAASGASRPRTRTRAWPSSRSCAAPPACGCSTS